MLKHTNNAATTTTAKKKEKKENTPKTRNKKEEKNTADLQLGPLNRRSMTFARFKWTFTHPNTSKSCHSKEKEKRKETKQKERTNPRNKYKPLIHTTIDRLASYLASSATNTAPFRQHVVYTNIILKAIASVQMKKTYNKKKTHNNKYQIEDKAKQKNTVCRVNVATLCSVTCRRCWRWSCFACCLLCYSVWTHWANFANIFKRGKYLFCAESIDCRAIIDCYDVVVLVIVACFYALRHL